jgi:hypothetical protein
LEAANLARAYDRLLHRFYDVSGAFEYLVDEFESAVDTSWWDEHPHEATKLESLATNFEDVRAEVLNNADLPPDQIDATINALRNDVDGLEEILRRAQAAKGGSFGRSGPHSSLDKALRALGLTALPTVKELRIAWLAALKLWHPDAGPASERSTRTVRAQEINAAYDLL